MGETNACIEINLIIFHILATARKHTEPKNEVRDITETFAAYTDLEKGIFRSKCPFAQCVFIVFSLSVICSFQFLYSELELDSSCILRLKVIGISL